MSTVPELATRDGSAPSPDLPRGECIMTTLADGTLRIDRAGPCILISAELADAIADNPSRDAFLDLDGCVTYDGAVLKIAAVNQTVIYRITEYVPAVRGYIAEWPD